MDELRDAIARAQFEYDPCYVGTFDEQADDVKEWYIEGADANMAALRAALADRPALIEELSVPPAKEPA